MDLLPFLKSVLEQDTAPVVLCDLEHTIIYMNPAAAENYKKYGGYQLMGANLLNCHNPQSREMINKVVGWFAESESNNIVHTFYNTKQNKDVYMVALRDDDKKLIGYYEKHEFREIDKTEMYKMD
ncbi:MAG: PAS domain-containing protein [Clostridia bacterium]|nr:PAS domain-containing protein [Clostridia bacterium]